MKYIKTYENFISDLLNFTSFKSKTDKLYPADFNDKERIKLEELGFSQSDNLMVFKSLSEDLKIEISKYFEELVPGASYVIYYVKTYNKSLINGMKDFGEFDKMLDYIKPKISQIDIRRKKI